VRRSLLSTYSSCEAVPCDVSTVPSPLALVSLPRPPPTPFFGLEPCAAQRHPWLLFAWLLYLERKSGCPGFRPSFVCPATQALFRPMVIFSFPLVSSTAFFTRDFVLTPVGSTDYSFLDVKWQPLSFGLLAFRWDGNSGYAPGLSIRGGNLTTRSPLLSVPG